MINPKQAVVMVEDNADLRELIRMTLGSGDFDLFESDSADKARELISAIRPEFVLLDIMLPGELDGFGLCRWIKSDSDLAMTKVIILSARGQAIDLQEGNNAGADAYLVKPFSPLELMQLLHL
jgi:DNA-binding response OmpR family regulator